MARLAKNSAGEVGGPECLFVSKEAPTAHLSSSQLRSKKLRDLGYSHIAFMRKGE